MLINRLNKRIELQVKTSVPDENGGFFETWDTYKEVWAEVKTIGVYENIVASRFENTITYIITIRYLNDINIANRIKCSDGIFKIAGIINRGNKVLEIKVNEFY
ncbi:MAG: phage head closure protein [Rickettsiales bacterium]|jgi:SPP1 family predicted phage head-tail adaptor|nr:phage head closure protein [Rickettsiales bacterium]